jgi:hypothetical protein
VTGSGLTIHSARVQRIAPLVLLLALLGANGCAAHYVSRGADLYAGGYYIEAAEVFERTEQRLPAASAADRARYGLYRGATLLALGDTPRAETWLAYCAGIVKADPATLSDDERVMLGRALTLVATRLASRPAPPGPATTVAASKSDGEVVPAEVGN